MEEMVEVKKGFKICKVCGMEFPLMKSDHYVAVGGAKLTLIGKEEPNLYDAIDCPYCGCQHLLNIRERNYTPMEEKDE